MDKKMFIEGMSCKHCVNHVEEALKGICGVKTAKVDLAGKCATVELAHEVEDDIFKAAIDKVGYKLTRLE